MSLIERAIRERIVLVGVTLPPAPTGRHRASLDELSLLVDTAGADEVGRIVQRRDRPDPATFVGKGKVEELREVCLEVDADTVVFDDELTPGQQFNLEKLLGRTAIDRTAVILDIFAQNAHTLEGKAQVELALLALSTAPPAGGRAGGLSQQAGRIGTRGPGETQLEIDRRRLQRRITKLEQDLEVLGKHAHTQRKARTRSRLSARSRSSATPTRASRRCSTGSPTPACSSRTASSPRSTRPRGDSSCPAARRCSLSDTVGFVRKLPHQLVEAFKSTLETVASRRPAGARRRRVRARSRRPDRRRSRRAARDRRRPRCPS